MALDAATAQELIRRLAADRDAYLESVDKTTELLLEAIAGSGNTTIPRFTGSGNITVPRFNPETFRRGTIASTLEVESVNKSSTFVGEEDSESDNGESYFAQTPLQPEAYDEEGLKEHIRTYQWTEEGKKILHGVVGNESLLRQKELFPTNTGTTPDRSHLTHYSIFDVGADGAPLPIRSGFDRGPESRSMQVWNRLKKTNADANKERKAVGRITIVREPSPLLFSALHYTFQKHFDMDEMFRFLIDHDPVLSHPHRAFSDDIRHQRSFVFNMEYFTIIGEGCVPPPWQHADDERERTKTHVPISRCSATIALSFEGPPLSRIRNKNRRVSKKVGQVYDPFSPWRVLSIQCYPDWHSSIETHDPSKNYVNGPEAFLVTLRAEFRDAAKRLMEVYRTITELVEPPHDFIFSRDVRDKLLFEDSEFTYSRRYFWAAQTLGIMNQDIRDMVETYAESFKSSVWDGTDKVIWPGGGSGDEASSRRANWRRRMALLRSDIASEIARLEEIERLNEKRMQIIKGLHENLFSGTSVHESRRSVEQAAITVEQGRNIKLLTLVTIFYLPLTFVTSVFGMTNMPPNDNFYHFAWTMIGICIPTYILIGTLTTQSGLNWWRNNARMIYTWIPHSVAKILDLFGHRPEWTKVIHEQNAEPPDPQQRPTAFVKRSLSTEAAMLTRAAIRGMPFLSLQRTKESMKDSPFGTETPDRPEHTSTPKQATTGNQEEEPHWPGSPTVKFQSRNKSARFPQNNVIDLGEGLAPTNVGMDRPTELIDEKMVHVERQSTGGDRKQLRKGSLAGFRDFWEWQKRPSGRLQSPDPV